MRACDVRQAAARGSLVLPVVGSGETHDPGSGGNTGSGGPISISASTLAERQIAAAVRYKFIRSSQVDDALLVATEQGKHWHSLRLIESVSLSTACSITNDVTSGDTRPSDGTTVERRFA